MASVTNGRGKLRTQRLAIIAKQMVPPSELAFWSQQRAKEAALDKVVKFAACLLFGLTF